MEQPPIEIRYSLDRWDILWAQLRLTFRNQVVIALCLFLLGFELFEELSTGHPMFLPIVFSGILLLSVIVLSTSVLVALMNTRGITGEHSIRLSDQGLTESTEFNTSLHRWSGILRVESTKRYLLILLGDFHGHVIPKHAFPSPAAAQEFEQRIRNSISNAKRVASKQT